MKMHHIQIWYEEVSAIISIILTDGYLRLSVVERLPSRTDRHHHQLAVAGLIASCCHNLRTYCDNNSHQILNSSFQLSWYYALV